ncbi:hypothetical protein [Oleisolibacter albus]|uniref:hypothetical protein n=1 Tax=Oleisolibacter albus TaxID=2171757 RepID=UPI000DF14356|nr:hypothetical protein [Oleisolibacter albus]
MSISAIQNHSPPQAPMLPEVEVVAQKEPKQEDGMSFWDLLDVVNPLQHIPVVNKIYRAVTGDEIKGPARMAGATLFFGPIGLAATAADMAVEHATGKDTVDNIASLFKDDKAKDGGPDAAPAATADAATADAAPGDRAAAAAAPAGTAPQAAGAAPVPGSVLDDYRRNQLKHMPGASAAAMAASGLPPQAALASLSAPGDAADANAIAALSAPAKTQQAKGKTLAQYRQEAQGLSGPVRKIYVPTAAVQTAMPDRGRVTDLATATLAPAAKPATASAGTPQQDAGAQAAGTPAAAEATRADTAKAGTAEAAKPGTPAGAPAGWPPGGPGAVPKAAIADLMMQAMNKYEAQTRARAAAAKATGTDTAL